MTRVSQLARRVTCGVGPLLSTLCLSTVLLSTALATAASASTIYQFRDLATSSVIGTIEIAGPPSSATTGWTTTDPSDLIALHLNDSLLGLGTGNLLSTATPTGAAVLSLDGSTLDIGNVGLTFPTIITINPLNPKVDRSLSLLFGVPSAADFIGLATIQTLASGSVLVADSFFFGDWEAVSSVPEPGAATLVVIGLAAAGRIARRKRR